MKLPRILIGAVSSGSGKTLITCALLQTLCDRGLRPAAFKCGPDYIDPMFHRKILGVPSKNLDTFFTGETMTRSLLAEPQPGGWENGRRWVPGENSENWQQTLGENSGNRKQTFGENRGNWQQDISVIEGVMGLYDGLGGVREEGSAYHLAKVTKTPVVLVIDAHGMGKSLLAVIAGFLAYDREHLIKGVILNRTSKMFFETIKPEIESSFPITALGYFPRQENVQFESRHLGLKLPEEIADIWEKIKRAAVVLQETVDIEKLLEIAGTAEKIGTPEKIGTMGENRTSGEPEAESGTAKEIGTPEEIGTTGEPEIENGAVEEIGTPGEPEAESRAAEETETENGTMGEPEVENGAEKENGAAPQKARHSNKKVSVAVAYDDAFCFYYEDNLRLLERLGAEILYFSPLRDTHIPKAASALLLGGGYPELYAEKLAENEAMKKDIREKIQGGMPVIAECGGFLYLHEELEDMEGRRFKMAGVVPGSSRYQGKLVRFGYVEIGEKKQNFLPEGEKIKGHEFHYFDSTANGTGCVAEKPVSGRKWDCVWDEGNCWFGFPHLYYYSNPVFAERFIEKAQNYAGKAEENHKI